MFVDDLFNKKTLTESSGGGSPWHAEPEQDMAEAGYKRDAYQRDYDNSVAGMGKRQSRAYQDDGGANDERHDLDPSDWYFVKDGKMFAISVYPNQEQEAIARGYSRTRAEAKAKADQQGVAEGSQRVDSLVSDALKIMKGPEVSDAVAALKTVLGDREFNGRRGFYNFYIKQMLDMYGQQGVMESKKHKINEAMLMEDPVYRKFKGVGRYIAERKMSEKEILQVFADAEAGMTDKGTGANRTMLGRGKDNTMAFAGSVKDAVTSVLSSIQNSVPVSAVDVAYDQATDALAGLSGGQRGKVMQAIKGYRNLVKEYPKASGFAKAALVAIAGLATGGAGLPAIAGLTYALDSAIRGDKLSSVLGKGVGAAAVTWGGQQAFGALKGTTPDGVTVPADQSIVPGETIVGPDDQISLPDKYANVPSRFDDIVSNAIDYKVKQGDTLSEILADRKINPEAFRRLPGNDVFFSPDGNPNILKAGQTIKLPDPADVLDLNKMSGTTPSDPNLAKGFGDTNFYTGQYNQNSAYGLDAKNNLQRQDFGRWGSDDGMAAARVAQDAGGQTAGMSPAEINQMRNQNLFRMQDQADAAYYADKPDDYGIPARSNYAVGSGLPGSAGPTNLGPNFNPDNIPPGWTMKKAPSPMKESIKFKILPVDRLIDRQGTVISWALQESIGVKRKSVNLTTTGAYTVFENVDRYRQAIMEKAGVPGSTRPAYYRPDMSGGPGKKIKPGIIGKGLNWLDKTAGKVGGALSNFGHQFTTNVTKEKLKMNWHQAGKPSDSDQIAAFLTKQGVPQEVVTTVYGKMGIPYTAPVVEPTPQPATEPDATAKSGIQTGATALIDPDTKRPYEKDKLAAMYGYKEPVEPTTPAVATNTTGAAKTPAVASNPAGFNAGNVMKLPGMEKYAKPAAPAKTANFAGPSGYGKITTSFKPPAAPSSPALAVPKAPAAPKVTAGGPTPDEKANLDKRIAAAAAAAPAVAETLAQVERMLESVNSKKSAEMVKAYVDQKFTELGLRNTTECRNLMARVVQESAIRRRQHAKSLAN
jgi:hypothetical protein